MTIIVHTDAMENICFSTTEAVLVHAEIHNSCDKLSGIKIWILFLRLNVQYHFPGYGCNTRDEYFSKITLNMVWIRAVELRMINPEGT